MKAFKQWKAAQNQERMLRGEAWQEAGLVFTREDGSAVRPSHFSRVFGRVAERAGVPPIPWHGLRHTWATWQLERGRSVHVVSEALGHSSAKVTLDVYATALPSQHEEAVAELAAAIDG